uniref:DEAD/DEAH-box helicase domain-containing protein n=1 Tax=uncultured marine thaumarchaeote SAT1000_04_B06 TaxID=1456354 RepID=A0A075HYE2_9ARCH|nr:hypothetical protein [uncultured marine thaumarchaeote SAT1000_04_B06]
MVIAPTGSGKTECSVIPTFSQIKKQKGRKDQATLHYSVKIT